MKIIETSGGALTNFEVLDLLRSRGVGKLASGSENKVFNFLEGNVACNQTREIVEKFVHECRKFDLANAEILNILNLRPKNEPELFTIIEDIGSDPPRMEDKAEELLETIAGILPPHPSAVKGANEESAEGEEETELETETEPAPCTT